MSTRKACEIDNDHLIAIPLFEQSRYGEIFEGSLLLYDDKYKMTAQFSSEPQKWSQSNIIKQIYITQ